MAVIYWNGWLLSSGIRTFTLDNMTHMSIRDKSTKTKKKFGIEYRWNTKFLKGGTIDERVEELDRWVSMALQNALPNRIFEILIRR